MDPTHLIVPIFGIGVAAAITFYAVSFTELSQKSFENIGGERPRLRSSLSGKEKRNLKRVAKEQKNASSSD